MFSSRLPDRLFPVDVVFVNTNPFTEIENCTFSIIVAFIVTLFSYTIWWENHVVVSILATTNVKYGTDTKVSLVKGMSSANRPTDNYHFQFLKIIHSMFSIKWIYCQSRCSNLRHSY